MCIRDRDGLVQTEESIEDFVGGMVTGNTETLITVTYDDSDGTMDFVVDNDLSNYDNSSSGFITATLTQEQVDNKECGGKVIKLGEKNIPKDTFIYSFNSDDYNRDAKTGLNSVQTYPAFLKKIVVAISLNSQP